MQTIIIEDVPRSLVHGDLLNRNVHVVGTGISGVFDWGNSLLGDHLYDLGLLCFWEPWLVHVRAQPVVTMMRKRWSAYDDLMYSFDDRLQSCVLHTALEYIAYHAYRNDWNEVDRVIEQMEAVANHRW